VTQAGFLPWLAGWLAMPLLEGWDEEKRREIIQRVPELYACADRRGLKLALRPSPTCRRRSEGECPTRHVTRPVEHFGRHRALGRRSSSASAPVEPRPRSGDLPRAPAHGAGAGGDGRSRPTRTYALVFQETRYLPRGAVPARRQDRAPASCAHRRARGVPATRTKSCRGSGSPRRN